MMVYLVRHGTALTESVDPERPLSKAGRIEVMKTARFMRRALQDSISTVHHSPKTRARETAEIIAREIGSSKLVEKANLLPLSDPGEWSYELSRSGEDTILVGHLPYMERLVSLLLSGDPEKIGLNIRAAGALCLERESVHQWSLLWMIEPDLLD